MKNKNGKKLYIKMPYSYMDAWDILRCKLDTVKDYSDSININKLLEQMDDIEWVLEKSAKE